MTLEQTALATLGLAERAVFHMPRTPRPAFGNPARAFERPRTNLGRSQGSTSALVWRRSPTHTPRTLQPHHRRADALVLAAPRCTMGLTLAAEERRAAASTSRVPRFASVTPRYREGGHQRRARLRATRGAWERSGPFAEGRVGRIPCGTVSLHRLQVLSLRLQGRCVLVQPAFCDEAR